MAKVPAVGRLVEIQLMITQQDQTEHDGVVKHALGLLTQADPTKINGTEAERVFQLFNTLQSMTASDCGSNGLSGELCTVLSCWFKAGRFTLSNRVLEQACSLIKNVHHTQQDAVFQWVDQDLLPALFGVNHITLVARSHVVSYQAPHTAIASSGTRTVQWTHWAIRSQAKARHSSFLQPCKTATG